MADTDDLAPPPKPAGEPDFETMGIEELEDFIAGLEETITRVRAVIAAKTSHRGDAESVFK
ncbi:MAG TPA: DUF1192 domain-containing protein [Alphaproteobacteria bacterium]|nr:DUF1192 domain-containing protein [Alphaproteobacteria bacterium]